MQGDLAMFWSMVKRFFWLIQKTPATKDIWVRRICFTGNPLKALNLFEELNKKDPGYSPQGYVGALVSLGRKEDALEALQSLPKSTTPVKKAMCYIHLNALDSAFKYLEVAYRQRDTQLTFLQVDPNFNSVKEEPRYKAMVRKMNFPKDF